jgi:hypothetical protein
MKKELDNYLVEKYPKIFINRYGDMKETAMCWGFEHREGWFWILDQLCDSIQSYIDNNNKYKSEEEKKIPQVVATQVKEKFGTLNFYYSGGNDYIDGMIRLAENMSANTCEFCGSIEDIGYTRGWIYTICKNCHENGEDRVKQLKWIERDNTYPIHIKELRKIKLDKLNKDVQDFE